jgi:tetratricopeptide (TPR) repeat protein
MVGNRIMSLVNDMLKDLETRHTLTADPSITESSGSGKMTMNDEPQLGAVNDTSEQNFYMRDSRGASGHRKIWLMTAVIFFVTLIVGWLLGTDRKDWSEVVTPVDKLLTSNVQDLTAEKPNGTDGEENQAADSHIGSESNERPNQVVELPSEKPVTQTEPEVITINQLLQEGEQALEAERLTTPAGDNAYERFQAVLAREPENAQALAGLQKVRQRYLSFIENLVKRKEFYAVPMLVRKARDVGADETELTRLLSQVTAEDGADKLNKIMKAFEPVKRDKAPASVQPSLQERDRLVAEKSEQLISNQHLEAAEKLLVGFLAENPKAVESVTQLFTVYIQQGRLSEAEALINQSAHLPGFKFSYMVAQLLIQRQDLEGALRALQSQQPPLAEVPAYYALQAGLLHQRGYNEKAVGMYQLLIDKNPQHAAYWLGLAVSLDSLRLVKPTLHAFEQTLRHSKPDDSYLHYVRQRIDALSAK